MNKQKGSTRTKSNFFSELYSIYNFSIFETVQLEKQFELNHKAQLAQIPL
jgi:hypothetical protein